MKKLSAACFWMLIVLFQFGPATGVCSEVICTYDELNRLQRIEKQGSYSIDYAYDAVGNRTSKVTILPPPQPVAQTESIENGTDASLTPPSYPDEEDNQ